MAFYDVVIVGAGIGGLTLGCALARKGRRVCILDARSRILPSKRGLTIQPNGLEALQKLGLLDLLVGIGAKTNRVSWFETSGRHLATLAYSVLDHPCPYLLTMVPSELELVLRKEFARKGGSIEESTAFQELSHDSKEVQLRAKRENSLVEFSAKIVVGADGENSRVREVLQLPTRVRQYSYHYLFLLAGRGDALQREARQYIGLGRMVGLFPTHDGTYIFCYFSKENLDKLRVRGIAAFKDELSIIEPDVVGLMDAIESWDDIAFTAAKKIVVQDWVADRAALLGDAAHALNPTWAQGANMALQDTLVLSETIEKCFRSNDLSAKALRPYEQKRRKQTTFIQQEAERTALITNTENSFYYWLGKRVLRKTGRNPRLMRAALQASSGLRDHFSLREQIQFVI